MSLPLPPSDPNRLGPAAMVEQGRRLRRAEMPALPTPRTYHSANTTAVNITTNTPALVAVDAFLQPDEVVGIMFAALLRSSAASTRFGGSVSGIPFASSGSTIMDVNPVATGGTGTLYCARYDANGIPSSRSGNIYGEFQWFISGAAWAITAPTPISISITGSRPAGAGTITVYESKLTVMIV